MEKKVITGINSNTKDPAEILLNAGVEYLRALGGYIPNKADVAELNQAYLNHTKFHEVISTLFLACSAESSSDQDRKQQILSVFHYLFDNIDSLEHNNAHVSPLIHLLVLCAVDEQAVQAVVNKFNLVIKGSSGYMRITDPAYSPSLNSAIGLKVLVKSIVGLYLLPQISFPFDDLELWIASMSNYGKHTEEITQRLFADVLSCLPLRLFNLGFGIFKHIDLVSADLSYVLMNHDSIHLKLFKPSELPMTGANLQGAQIEGEKSNTIPFNNANLIGANLSFAEFRYVNISRANLSEATLNGATFVDCLFMGSTMPDGNLWHPTNNPIAKYT